MPLTYPTIHEFTIPTPNSLPTQITIGPDGALWFLESQQGNNQIGRLDPTTGIVTDEYPVPSLSLADITKGRDGALWFTANGIDAMKRPIFTIGRINTVGNITQTNPGDITMVLNSITTGPDNRIWFTEFANAEGTHIGSITYDPNKQQFNVAGPYPAKTAGAGASSLTRGPDGTLWFTETTDQRPIYSGVIGHINIRNPKNPQFTDTPVPNVPNDPRIPNALKIFTPFSITTGPDGALWFIVAADLGPVLNPPVPLGRKENYVGGIGRIDTNGIITNMFPLPFSNARPYGITKGPGFDPPNGALWFTEFVSNQIMRMDTMGNFIGFSIPTPKSFPLGITVGPDNAIWFTENTANKIGRLEIP